MTWEAPAHYVPYEHQSQVAEAAYDTPQPQTETVEYATEVADNADYQHAAVAAPASYAYGEGGAEYAPYASEAGGDASAYAEGQTHYQHGDGSAEQTHYEYGEGSAEHAPYQYDQTGEYQYDDGSYGEEQVSSTAVARADATIRRCKVCHKALNDTARYCRYCGADNG